MFDDLQCAVKQLRRLLAGPEPDRFDGAGARTLVEPEHKHRHRLRLDGPPGRMRFVSANEWVPRC